MVDRIIFDKPNGLRVSKKGFDANYATPENMVLFSGMNPCIPILQSQAVFTGSGTISFPIVNPKTDMMPFVLLRSSDNAQPYSRFGDSISGLPTTPGTYFAQLYRPYNVVQIVNDQNIARTIYFTVLV